VTPDFASAILCGGASVRMGRDKATLEVDGIAMGRRVADACREAGSRQVAAIGGDADELGRLGLTVVADDEPGDGPLPATITALRWAPADLVVVLSCDLVAPNPAAIGLLVERLAVAPPEVLGAVPVVAGHHQWTHAAWRRAALVPLEAARRRGVASLRKAGAGLALELVTDLSPHDVADADVPGDLPGAG
jgi:molybdopterin-guanine dinucleotide biosynthesis protein A